jgi:hypothetical protein
VSEADDSAERSIALSLPTRWTKMRWRPSTFRTYATVSPSGESAGERSTPGSDVTRSKKREGADVVVRPRRPARKPATRRARETATSAADRTQRRGCSASAIAGCTADVRVVESVARLARANARSPADWKRSAGAFSRHRSTTRASAGGHASGRAPASSRSVAVIVSAAVSRWNGRFPVSISWTTQPSEKMSERASAACPRTCSGDM